MAYDPDLQSAGRQQPSNPNQPGLYQQFQNLPSQNLYSAVNNKLFSTYQSQPPGPYTKLVLLVMTGLTIMSGMFLLVAALYSLGWLPGSDPETDGSSAGALILMSVFSGIVGSLTAYMSLRQSERLGSRGFDKLNKILFLGIILLVVLVMIGPVTR